MVPSLYFVLTASRAAKTHGVSAQDRAGNLEVSFGAGPVRDESKSDIPRCPHHVRFASESGFAFRQPITSAVYPI
jgi:hypothetical protein